jgi:plasmid stabilization system protein ParE
MYTLTRLVEKDIREIWKYTVDQWGESQAVDYVSGLEKSPKP